MKPLRWKFTGGKGVWAMTWSDGNHLMVIWFAKNSGVFWKEMKGSFCQRTRSTDEKSDQIILDSMVFMDHPYIGLTQTSRWPRRATWNLDRSNVQLKSKAYGCGYEDYCSYPMVMGRFEPVVVMAPQCLGAKLVFSVGFFSLPKVININPIHQSEHQHHFQLKN